MSEKEERHDSPVAENTGEIDLSDHLADETILSSQPGDGQSHSPAPGESRTSTDQPERQGGKVDLDLEGLKPKTKESPSPPPADLPSPPPDRSPKKKVRPKPLFVTAALLVLLAGFSLGYRYHRLNKGGEEKEPIAVESSRSRAASTVSSDPEEDQYHTLAPFFVPIGANQDGTEGFLKIGVTLIFRGDGLAEEITRKRVLIRGAIADRLFRMNLSLAQSPEARSALQKEIRNLVNAQLVRGKVDQVYFDELLSL